MGCCHFQMRSVLRIKLPGCPGPRATDERGLVHAAASAGPLRIGHFARNNSNSKLYPAPYHDKIAYRFVSRSLAELTNGDYPMLDGLSDQRVVIVYGITKPNASVIEQQAIHTKHWDCTSHYHFPRRAGAFLLLATFVG
jgi:hypothetical protein